MYVHTYVSTCYVFTYVCVYLWIPDKYSLIFWDCWAFVDAVTSLLDQLTDKARSFGICTGRSVSALSLTPLSSHPCYCLPTVFRRTPAASRSVRLPYVQEPVAAPRR